MANNKRDTLIVIAEAYKKMDIELTAKLEEILGVYPEVDFEDFDSEFGQITRRNILNMVRKLYDKKDKKVKDIEKLVKTQSLPKELQDALDKVGNTPMDEPEIADKTLSDIDRIKVIEEKTGTKEADWDRDIYDKFCGMVTYKVTSFLNEKQEVKITPIGEKFGLVSREEIAKIQKATKGIAEDDHEEVKKAILGVLRKNRPELLKGATEWEQEYITLLVRSQIHKTLANFIKGF